MSARPGGSRAAWTRTGRGALADVLRAARAHLALPGSPPRRKAEGEGGCGVIGLASSVPVAGRHLLQSLEQMRNRGNGKGGGIAAVGLDPRFFGVDRATLEEDYLLAVAYLDPGAMAEAESTFIAPTMVVDHRLELPALPDHREIATLDVRPPTVICYFVRVKSEVRDRFMAEHAVPAERAAAAEDEIVYQNSFALNRALYAATGDKRAFVLSHAKNLLVAKLVGYGEDVVRYWRLEDLHAHVWIGHHRYPTKGRVWHPGGAHPFIGMHEALVHNGDFANYASIASYLAQNHIYPLFLTDTEVAVLVFDLLHRTWGYPLEYVIEALAPTTERDFTMLPADTQRVYRMLQTVHVHGSPDGPWFFLVAQSEPVGREFRLIGITDTSMLRPQVFALQRGEAAIGFAASEKQGIDAALASLASTDPRFWPRADVYWNARGGSHTDGGAFIFNVSPSAAGHGLVCTDKFGRAIDVAPGKQPATPGNGLLIPRVALDPEADAERLWRLAAAGLAGWGWDELAGFVAGLEDLARSDAGLDRALEVLTRLVDRRVGVGNKKRSAVVSIAEQGLARVLGRVRTGAFAGYAWADRDTPPATPAKPGQILVIDAGGFAPDGPGSVARAIVDGAALGFSRLIVTGTRGHRFIGCGLGAGARLRIDVYGSPGDYLASGVDGCEVVVHASGQDQLAQIMKDGRLVVHGDVGQTFGYAAKGGQVFVLGNAAGRPLINAVGRPRVVINGTCLDYLAESFMAGDPHNGGGFVVLNGLRFNEDGEIVDLDTPYPGSNLFSLASGGAIFVRDPRRALGEDQLNGGAFAEFATEDWQLIRPLLEENERLFGIPVTRLLSIDGAPLPPGRTYRKIQPAGHEALQPEEAWVGQH
jgi:glutamate synthase domain-containing protein 1/glutamate synthase domain-containing protein 3